MKNQCNFLGSLKICDIFFLGGRGIGNVIPSNVQITLDAL